MADGTKAVVDASAAEEEAETTAPLSASEIAAELTDRAASAAADEDSSSVPAEAAGTDDAPADEDGDDGDSDSDEKPDDDDDAAADDVPEDLPVPQRHSGDKIADRYRLEECTSQTAVFSSWRAVDEKLRRAVGVHLMAAGHHRAKDVLAAARSAALLGDPRFVQVLDAVQEGDLVYVIREWLPGATDLATLLADGPMEPYDAYQMVRQVAEAVAAAHRSGRSHLRLTPRCVLRTDTGQYRINGVAVDAALRGLPEEDAELVDTRAIGVLLYASLTHRWPYPEDRYDLQGLPKSLGCVPPDQVRAGIHRGLSDLAARTLCDPPPHHLEPITTPAELTKAIALLPRIRQPQPDPAQPGLAQPRYSVPEPVAGRTSREPREPHPAVERPAPAPATMHQERIPARPAPRRRAKRLLKWTLSVTLLAAIGYGSWHLASQLGNGGSGSSEKQALGVTGVAGSPSPATSMAPLKPVTIAGVTSFNPLGDGPMHTDQLPLTYDNNPSTSWQTEGYLQNLTTIGHGTGLLVDLGSTTSVGEVSVQFAGGDTTAELRVPSGSGATAPSQFTDFGDPVATSTGSTADFRPTTPVHTRYLLIWLTSLPNDGAGTYRGKVAEIKVAG
ncbi:protein kinase family protein [Kitasatospora mediocidica]|uniref:protein kinase family protein n=1 Tax=Kitasatospora mediocidica TaxID=58352 RepID=UPI00068B8139|nr:protein kinase family protein [Kitasatospora mediocidica]